MEINRVDLQGADLATANFQSARVFMALLGGAKLDRANLGLAYFRESNFWRTRITEVSFKHATFLDNFFVDVDLSRTMGLSTVRHAGPSFIDVLSLENSGGGIPEEFLRGCGFKPWQILDAKLYNPNLTRAEIIDIQYEILDARSTGSLLLGGVFISYSHADAGFADKIREKLTEKGVPVWLDRHDAVAGPLQKQIDHAIGAHNAVLLVLSEDSIASDWVEHELKTARRIERKEGRDVLCPVRLDDAWKDKRHDVNWGHITDKNILDFSKWRTKAFSGQFEKLLKGLKIYYTHDEDENREAAK